MDYNNETLITTIPLSSPLNELFAALAKAQAQMQVAFNNSDNPFFKSKYANFAEIVQASRPALSSNGLSIIQRVVTLVDGSMLLHSVLGHSSGQYIDSTLKISPSKTDIQSLGSYITYLKRYAYAALVAVCTDSEDDDGESAMHRPHAQNSNTSKGELSGVTITPDQVQTLQEIVSRIPQGDEMVQKIFAFRKIVNFNQLLQDHYQNTFDYLRRAVR
jgi:hypothetical protein